MTKRKAKSASELMAELNSDPAYVARRSALEDSRILRDAEVRYVTQPLLDRLAAAGYPVSSIDETVSLYAPLPARVVDLILEFLTDVNDSSVQDQLCRALGASAVPIDGLPLITLFRNSKSDSVRYAIANTMALGPVTGIGPWALETVQDSGIGTARQMLVLAAARNNDAAIVNPVLVKLLGEIPGHAALALAETGGHRELDALESAYSLASGWEKREIGRSISVIRRRIAERK